MADEKAPEATTTQETPNEAPVKASPTVKTYTEAELNAEADRRATATRKSAIEEYERKLNEAKEQAEAERLAEQGEFKTLHEKAQTELEALKARVADAERRDKISNGLREANLTQFEKVLLSDRNNPDDFVAAAKSLEAIMKEAVDAEVARRLETGTKATPKTDAVSADSQASLKSLYPDMFKESA